jgi:hypothetical protein
LKIELPDCKCATNCRSQHHQQAVDLDADWAGLCRAAVMAISPATITAIRWNMQSGQGSRCIMCSM